MAVTFDNTTFNSAQSTTGVTVANLFTGTNVLSGATPVTINGTIDAPGSQAQVSLNLLNTGAVSGTGTYLGFSNAPGGNYVYYFSVNVASLPTPVTIGVTGAAALPTLSATPITVTPGVTAPVGPATPCYAAGTLIRTARGEVKVEDLAVGDEVITASGARRPIMWLGHRVTECAAHPAPSSVQPIRIRAHAVAPGMPARDLRVSPDHALFFDDVLVQARFLVNGSTIVRDEVASVTYWHVELESHDVLLAENMPAESYLDVGNRNAFMEGTVVSLRPDFATDGGEGHCAPLVVAGERLQAVRAWLADRARHLGATTTADSGLRLLADGAEVTPVTMDDGRLAFAVPAGIAKLRLASRSAVPAEVTLDSSDSRRLGLCVTGIEVDGVPLALDDARLDAGWHASEGGLRWTDGEATLPKGRLIVLAAHGLGIYPLAGVRTPIAAEARPMRMAG